MWNPMRLRYEGRPFILDRDKFIESGDAAFDLPK
jgi:hypothetical protein